MRVVLCIFVQASLQKLFDLVDVKLEYATVKRDAHSMPLSIVQQLFTGNRSGMKSMVAHWEAYMDGVTYSVHFDGGSQRPGHDWA